MIWRWIRRGAHTREAASAFLDGELSPRRADAFRRNLRASPDLQAYVEELQETKHLLREMPEALPSRSFALSAAQAARLRDPRLARGAAPVPRAQTGLRAAVAFSTVAAAALLAVVTVDLTSDNSTPVVTAVEQAVTAIPQANPDGVRSTASTRPAPSPTSDTPAQTASGTPAQTANVAAQETPAPQSAAAAPVAEAQEAAVAAVPASEPDTAPDVDPAPETDATVDADTVKPPTDAVSTDAAVAAREETPESEDGADAAQADGSATGPSQGAATTNETPAPVDQASNDQAPSDQAPSDQANVAPATTETGNDSVSNDSVSAEAAAETSDEATPPPNAPAAPAVDADAAGPAAASSADVGDGTVGPAPSPSPVAGARSTPPAPEAEAQPALATVVDAGAGSDADWLLALEIGLGLLLGLGLGAAMWQGLRRT